MMDNLINMSSQSDMVGLMLGKPFIPKKCLFVKNSSFFEDGNDACKIYSKQFVTAIDDEVFLHKELPAFPCGEKRCQKAFNTVYAYELHYRSIHSNCCSECKKQFSSDLLLQHHIEKEHDPFLKATESKCENVYRCFVKDCGKSFQSTSDRTNHLVRVHAMAGEMKKQSRALENKMDTSEMQESSSLEKKKYVPRVPQSVCFGMGSTRSFIRPKKKKNPSNSKPSVKETDITMRELDVALP